MNVNQSYHNPMLTERPDLETARAYLEVVITPGTIFEIRILNTRRGGPNRLWHNTYSGFFDNIEIALSWITRFTGADTAGVYVTLNPLKPYVLNWNHNIIEKSVASAADDDVEAIADLFIDIDPVRPRFTCSTDEEHERSRRTGNAIACFLVETFGFPMPVWAGSSGSGSTAIYRLDFHPANDFPIAAQSKLIERCLHALDSKFSTELVSIDTGVFNPARIARVSGTINAKSPTPQPDRPWRRATGTAFVTRPVTRDQLEALAALAPAEEPEQPRSLKLHQLDQPRYDLRNLLINAGIRFTEKERPYGTAFDLRQCLTSHAHDSGASFIQMDSGAVAYRCLHASCSGKSWQDVKHHLNIRPVVTTSQSKPVSSIFTPIKIGANGRVSS